jgi:cardiolipin synthase A/B
MPKSFGNKLLAVDRELVSVGSTNFDQRSFQLNDEASLNVYDKTFAQRMTVVFEDDLTKAQPYTLKMWKERSWTEKVAEKFVSAIKSIVAGPIVAGPNL